MSKKRIFISSVHRDYTSNASIQVMLFKNRLEVWNPGHLPPGITIEQLYQVHESFPTNPLIANPFYLAGYAECIGTGTMDIIKQCVAIGLKPPAFSQSRNFRTTFWRNEDISKVATSNENDATNVAPFYVKKIKQNELEKVILKICKDKYVKREELLQILGKSGSHIRNRLLPALLKAGKMGKRFPFIDNHSEQGYKTTDDYAKNNL